MLTVCTVDEPLYNMNLSQFRMNDNPFIIACRHNDLNVVKELMMMDGDKRINPQLCEDGFHSACESNSFDVAKYLLSLNDERRIQDASMIEEEAYEAQYEKRTEILELLLSLKDERKLSDQCIEELTESEDEDTEKYFSYFVEKDDGTLGFVTEQL